MGFYSTKCGDLDSISLGAFYISRSSYVVVFEEPVNCDIES